jgi:lipopolysaccharide/colanic/teichoic acid biosynthesis glycosyltransferase
MILRKWEDIPAFMRCEEVKDYYDILSKKKGSLRLKRVFDIVVALIMLIILAIPMLIIAVTIKLDSPGPVFYRQERVTTYGKRFRIHKFRTMVNNADKIGSAVTVGGDARITKVGNRLRNLRIDEIPQLLDVLKGNMSFVGTRPEATKYVEQYSNEMNATLLLPAGITSEASIRYKDEAMLLDAADDIDRVYVEEVLPGKMQYNLQSIKEFSFFGELTTMIRTVFAVLGKDYS